MRPDAAVVVPLHMAPRRARSRGIDTVSLNGQLLDRGMGLVRWEA